MLKLKKIRLRDTDATGVIYFTELLRMALENLEDCFSLKEMMEKEHFFIPVVHAEADYFAPLMVGDEVEISIKCTKIGDRSFTLSYDFFDRTRNLKVGTASIIHVVVSKEMRQSIVLPEKVRTFLQQL